MDLIFLMYLCICFKVEKRKDAVMSNSLPIKVVVCTVSLIFCISDALTAGALETVEGSPARIASS